jgi:hypothetical protein
MTSLSQVDLYGSETAPGPDSFAGTFDRGWGRSRIFFMILSSPEGEVWADSGFFMSLPGFRPLHPALHGILTVPLATNYYLSLWDEGKMMAKCLGALLP